MLLSLFSLLAQADLLFKNDERDKSEATTKTLGDGEWCVWSGCTLLTLPTHTHAENGELRMNLSKVEDVSVVLITFEL